MFIKSLILSIIITGLFACSPDENPDQYLLPRIDKIPEDIEKINPITDAHPPILHSTDFEEPIPMVGLINTAGAEDSPFMANDRDEFYFFFTPDVRVPVEKQILDSVTGIYRTEIINNEWKDPERVFLQDLGKLALDGCQYVHADSLWFCSAREGYTGLHWFLAREKDGKWTDWNLFEFDQDYQVGELHFHKDQLFYHSSKEGGQGGLDLWMLSRINNEWTNPQNLQEINSEADEGWPCIANNGQEIWFTRTYLGTPAIYRSKWLNNSWQSPELILSQFAGEPTVDKDGNVYFVHHFFKDGKMIEADIYVCKKK